ncbi:GNAT family N-acetyltransferase [Viridibacterium curvum]|uniref:GNAT family protein n=1 Tax=Viridibacterium curvum TaxID=1101404 RepID=A0ABP9QRJ0_9RHOO
MSTFDFRPWLEGAQLSLRPISEDDFEQLYAAAADPLIWAQHPDPQRHRREIFLANFFAGAISSPGALIVIDKLGGGIIGSSRYYDWNPDRREVAIGYTFLARSHWGGAANSEMKRLMLDHAFGHVDTVWLHIGSSNLRSRRAAEKIGARFSHEEVRTLAGLSVPYAFYRLDKPRA